MTRRIVNSGASPDDWMKKLKTTMDTKPAPSIKNLREILRQGQEANVSQESLDTLKEYIEMVDNWILDVERILQLKSDPRSSSSTKKKDQRIRELIDQAELIGFELPHIYRLKTYYEKLKDFNDRLTDQVLTSNNEQLKLELYNEGLKLRVDTVQFNQLKNSLESCSWEEQAEHAMLQPYSPKVYRKLIREAQELGMTVDTDRLYERMIELDEIGKECIQRVDNICKGREKINFDEEESILLMGQDLHQPGRSLTLDITQINRLKHAMNRSKATIQEIADLMNPENVARGERPSAVEAQRLMSLCRELSFKSDLVPQLSDSLAQMSTWNDLVRSTFMNGRQKSLETVIRETLANVQRITEHGAKPGIWCICRKAESGLMIECDVCHEWYHSSCLKVPRLVVRSSSNYVCPICLAADTTKKFTHFSRQPRLEEITELVELGERLKFSPKDWRSILDVHTLMQKYRDQVQAFCRSKLSLQLEDIKMIKHYLRTLIGLEISLQDEADFLRSKITTLMPMTLPAPTTETPKHVSSQPHSPSYKTNCICQRVEDNKQHMTQCFHCKAYSHTSCIRLSIKDGQFKCADCQSMKRSSEEITSPRTQKIIKLTVKPPLQPLKQTHHTSNSKKRQSSPPEQERHTKKHRTLDDDYRPHLV